MKGVGGFVVFASFFIAATIDLEGSEEDVGALDDDFEDFRFRRADKFSTSPRKLWVMSTALLISNRAINDESYKNQEECRGVISEVD